MWQHAAAPVKTTEKRSHVKEEKTVPDLTQRDVQKQKNRETQKNRTNREVPTVQDHQKKEQIDKCIGNKVVRAADDAESCDDYSLEE